LISVDGFIAVTNDAASTETYHPEAGGRLQSGSRRDFVRRSLQVPRRVSDLTESGVAQPREAARDFSGCRFQETAAWTAL
jgi:hypothetical protein